MAHQSYLVLPRQQQHQQNHHHHSTQAISRAQARARNSGTTITIRNDGHTSPDNSDGISYSHSRGSDTLEHEGIHVLYQCFSISLCSGAERSEEDETNTHSTVVGAKGDDAYLMHVRIVTLTPTSGDIPFANCHCIIDSYESVVSFADAKGFGVCTFSFKPQVLAPPQHHSRCSVLSLVSSVQPCIHNQQRSPIESAPRSSL